MFNTVPVAAHWFPKILHVSPELSESGLALYILENIDHIVRCLFNINIIALVVCPKLKDLGHEGDWIYANDEDGTEQKRMVSLLRKTGFSKIRNSEYFAKGFY